jgi:cell division septal protein FtsQ
MNRKLFFLVFFLVLVVGALGWVWSLLNLSKALTISLDGITLIIAVAIAYFAGKELKA